MPFVYMPDPPTYGPPNHYAPPMSTLTPEIEARAIKIAAKLVNKEAKKKAKEEEIKDKKKADDKRKLEEKKSINLLSLEWFILGLLLYPIVGPAYNILTHYLQTWGH